MIELHLNTTTREWYNRDGDPFRDFNPQTAFLSRETIKITAFTQTPGAGEVGVNPDEWERDSSWAAIPGIGALITVDSDYIHKIKGTLAGGVAAGAVSSITATINGAAAALIPESGTLRLYDSSNEYEAIAYTGRAVSGDKVTFAVSGNLNGDYADNSIIDCDQAPYCSAWLNTAKSSIENGEFVFELTVDSPRLRGEMEYSDVQRLSIRGLELMLYRAVEESVLPVAAFICDTFAITGTLGTLGYEAEPPEPVTDHITGTVSALIAAGNEIELSDDGVAWHRLEFDENGAPIATDSARWVHVRNRQAGGAWSDPIPLPPGPRGEQGEKGDPFTIDAVGLLSGRGQYDNEAINFAFLASDTEAKNFSFLEVNTGIIYHKLSKVSGDWNGGFTLRGGQGDKGETGTVNAIISVTEPETPVDGLIWIQE